MRKRTAKSGASSATQAYKPGSVLTAIYLAPQLLTGSSRLLGTGGRPIRSSTAVLRDRVYIVKPMLPWAAWALTPRFQPYPRRGGISLLHLSWGFPRRALPVIPCPVEPGLSSSAAFRHTSAAVRPGCGNIVLYRRSIVKCLAKSFVSEYTNKESIFHKPLGSPFGSGAPRSESKYPWLPVATIPKCIAGSEAD